MEDYLTQLSDLLEENIDQNDPNIQYVITSMLEFRELEAEERENPPEKFKKFKHQEFFCRLMAQMDTQLVIDDPGTGKSCLASSICEYLYNQKMKMLADDRPYDEKNAYYKYVFFICSSKTLQDEFRRQVMNKCTDRFLSDDEDKRIYAYKLFSQWYKLETYLKFAKKVNEMSDDKIINLLSDCVFIVEEAHNVILNNETDVKGEITTVAQKKMVYNSLLRVFNIVENSKIILLSATPMLNNPSEITQLMNLILKNNPFPKKFDVEKATIEELEPYFRGKISYVRALKSDVKVIEEIKPNDKSQIYNIVVNNNRVKLKCNLYKSTMSDFQAKYYGKLVINKKINDLKRINVDEMQASNFIFPDGYYGKGYTEEERKNMNDIIKQNKKLNQLEEEDLGDEFIIIENMEITEKRGSRRFFNIGLDEKKSIYNGITEDFRNFFKDYKDKLSRIKILSCKIYEIIRNIMEKKENVYVYSDHKPAGIFAVAACLEIMGFTRFNESESAFDYKHGNKIIRKNIKKSDGINIPYRYTLFTDSSTDKKKEVMLELMNSYENRHGDYIRVFLTSRVGRDGINLSNILQIHLLAPGWNKGGMIQATARGLRALSHDDLLNELPKGEELIVKVFNHSAIYPIEPEKSIDIIRYEIVEEKGYRISRILRIMKMLANGCQLTRKRNIRKGQDYSFECDYDRCEYECWGPIFDPETDEIRTINYDILYSDEKIKLIMNKIIKIYKYYNILNFEEFCGMIDSNPKHIALALEKIIKKKINFRDRFGYQCYLKENNGCFYTEREYNINTVNNSSLSFYTQGIIGVKYNNIDEIELENNYKNRIISIIENAIIKIINNDKLDTEEEKDIEKYSSLIYNIGTPYTLLSLIKEGPKTRKVPKKRIEGVDEKKEFDINDIDEYLNSEEYEKKNLYIHLLSSIESKITNYSATFGFNKAYTDMRIINIDKYKENGVGWRDMSEKETKVFSKIISEINDQYYKEYEEKFDFYGIKLPGKNLLIKDVRAKKNKSELFKKESTGTACKEYSKKEIFELFWTMRLDISKYSNIKLDNINDFTKDELYNEILKKKSVIKDPTISDLLKKSKIYDHPFNKWSKERLMYYHNLFKCFKDINKDEKESIKFCAILEQEFADREQLLT